MTIDTTLDGLLNRRVALEQPADGYRVAVDTVLLAAAVPAQEGQRVLDIGCGVGGAFLALACRVAGLTGVGLDCQEDLIEICRRNIDRNVFAAGFTAVLGDATQLPQTMQGGFDLVMINPPYHEESSHDVSSNAIKREANAEKEGDLLRWLASAAQALKPNGVLTLIHRADRREEIERALQETGFGAAEVVTIEPRKGKAATRVVLRARRGAIWSLRDGKPLVLHDGQSGFTGEAEALFREAVALPFGG